MIQHIQHLIGALREELQEYGEMLALLDRQHQLIMVRAAEEVYQSISTIQAQGSAIQEARAAREKWRRSLAMILQQPDHAGCNLGNHVQTCPAHRRQKSGVRGSL